MNSYVNCTTEPSLLEQVKAAMPDIEQVLYQLYPGRQVTQRGSRIWTLCMFHPDDTASFMIDRTTNKAHCFGCHYHDDAMGFWLKSNGLEMRNGGLKALAEWLGISVTQTPEARQSARRAIAERQERAELSDTATRLIRTTRQHYSHLERITAAALRSCPAKTETDLNHDWFWRLLEMRENATHILDLLQGMTEAEQRSCCISLRKGAAS